MTVSAKFKVQSITEAAGYQADEVLLVPDYAGGKNQEWASATPSGTIRMHIGQDTAARKEFAVGRSFTILFEPELSETGGALLSGDTTARVKVTE